MEGNLDLIELSYYECFLSREPQWDCGGVNGNRRKWWIVGFQTEEQIAQWFSKCVLGGLLDCRFSVLPPAPECQSLRLGSICVVIE